MSEAKKNWPPDHPQHKLNHPSFAQPSDTSMRVWRYFDLAKFVWLLEHRKLFFPSLEMLDDPHEGSHTKRYIELTNRYVENFDHGDKVMAQLREYAMSARKTMHVNCWHINDSESEAMWRLYCPDSQGVAIQTTYEELVASIDDDPELLIGCVVYLDYETEVISQGNMFDAVMQKRLSFSHEQEVRLVKSLTDNEAESFPNGISVNWLLVQTIEQIYVNPYAPQYFDDVVKAVVRRFEPELEDRICWSQMRSVPLY